MLRKHGARARLSACEGDEGERRGKRGGRTAAAVAAVEWTAQSVMHTSLVVSVPP